MPTPPAGLTNTNYRRGESEGELDSVDARTPEGSGPSSLVPLRRPSLRKGMVTREPQVSSGIRGLTKRATPSIGRALNP